MNKAELVAAVAEKTNFTKKDAELAINALVASVEEALVKGEKVQLIGFGTFETRERKARQGRNPRKPEEVIEIEASKAPVFKAGKALKDAVNKQFTLKFMRIDKFLKNSRLIKRRSVAKDACDQGRVFVNDKVAQAGTEVKIGDTIKIEFGNSSIAAKVLNLSESQIGRAHV